MERQGLRRTMAAGLTTLMALSLPLVALPGGPLVAGDARQLVSVLYAFALNPCFTELAEAVDRRGSVATPRSAPCTTSPSASAWSAAATRRPALTAHASFLAALVAAAGVMLLSVPCCSWAGTRSRAGSQRATPPLPGPEKS